MKTGPNKRVESNIKIDSARIAFRNFSGKEGKFNPAGRMNFCVLLDPDVAEVLEVDGWNIRYLDPKEEGDLPQAYLQVAVSYDNIPPKVFLVTNVAKTLLDESSISVLDFAEIENVDLIIRPYNYSISGKEGVKAYLKVMYFKIVEDEYEAKYRNVPDSAANCVGPDCPIG